MASLETETDVKTLIDDCIRENWSIQRVKNILKDLDLDPEKEKELLRKVQVAKDLKKAAKEEAEAREKEFENVPVGSFVPEQLEFFDKALLRISSKDDQRALEAIVKECLRLGISGDTIQEMLRLMAIDNPDIKDAAEKIDHL